MDLLLGIVAGALLVFGAALASIWLQQRRETRTDRATDPRHPSGG